MAYGALTAFLSKAIAKREDIPEADKTPEYWSERLGREWYGLPSEELAEKLLPFFREFNRLCEFEKQFKLVQSTALLADGQSDHLDKHLAASVASGGVGSPLSSEGTDGA